MWIANGGFADVYIVFAKVNGEKFTSIFNNLQAISWAV
jgi:alkylation response protein AidB-like acyl-CoA dehydrogenase